MKRTSLVAFFLLPLISGCSGGGGSTPNALPPKTVPLVSQNATGALTEAQSDAIRPHPLYTPSTNDLLYVGNVGNNSITVYHHDAHGNTAPLKVILGSKTDISNPGQLSEDAQGNLYVANGFIFEAGSNPGILVFAHGANGNVAPIRKLNPSAGLTNIEAMTVDQNTGKIFVVESPGSYLRYSSIESTTLLRFPPNAAGNALPFARGSVTYPAIQLASDSTGNNLMEAHFTDASSSVGFGVETLVKQFPNNSSPRAVHDTGWFGAAGIADDPTTKTYLAMSDGSGIYRLAENTVGSGPGSPVGETFAPPPISVITSDTCGQQLALGYLRNIYVTHSTALGCSEDGVYVYTHDSSGDVAPLRVLTGGATKLNQPYGIYEGQ